MKTLFALLLSWVALYLPTRAQLVFDTPSVEKTAGLDDAQLAAQYAFRNTGTYPVHILKIRPSCYCTVANLEKDVIPPGGSGSINIIFKLGNRRGTEIKTITVLTDDHAHSDTMLRLVATIPELIRLDPAFVYWRVGEKPEPKTIKVIAGTETLIPSLQVTSSSLSFKTEVKTVKEGREFTISVTPEDTATQAKTELTIKTPLPSKRASTVSAFAQVK